MVQNKTLLTPSLLDHFPSQGQGIYLSIPESHNPQPLLLDGSASYLHGPSGLPGGMKRREDGRGIVEEEIYGFWVDMGDGIVVSTKYYYIDRGVRIY